MPNSGKNHMQASVFKTNSSLEKTPEKCSLFIREDVRPHFSSSNGSVREKLNNLRFYNSKRRVCVTEAEGTKNMVKVEKQIEKRSVVDTLEEQRGKIVEYAWWIKKRGYAKSTFPYWRKQ
jgi:hypothetical protein